MQVLFPGSPCWTRTNDAYGQKHSRIARLERFAMFVVSSCSEHRFICRRQRGAPSQLTAVWQSRRFGSTSKVKKSRKTGVSLLFLAPPVGLEPTTLRLTVVVTRISNSIIRFHTVYNRDFTYITQLINGSRGAKNR